MIFPFRSTQERIADVRRNAARLRRQGGELRELASVLPAPVRRERMHMLARDAAAAARTMEDMVAVLGRELETEA